MLVAQRASREEMNDLARNLRQAGYDISLPDDEPDQVIPDQPKKMRLRYKILSLVLLGMAVLSFVGSDGDALFMSLMLVIIALKVIEIGRGRPFTNRRYERSDGIWPYYDPVQYELRYGSIGMDSSRDYRSLCDKYPIASFDY